MAPVSTEAFRYEAAMTAPVLASAHRFAGRRVGAVQAFTEVQAARGVADIVIVQFDPTVVEARPFAVLHHSDLLVLLAADDHQVGGVDAVAAPDLAKGTGLSPGYVARTCLPRLRDRGMVVNVGRGRWSQVAPYAPPVRTLVTVELKRRCWPSALRQASQHGIGADFAWTVLDATALRPARDPFVVACDAHRQRGVGFATITAGGRLVLHVPARAGGPLSHRSMAARANRALLSERVFALALEGVTSGPAWPVFGRDLAAVAI